VKMKLNSFLTAMAAAHGGQLPLDPNQRLALEHKFDTPLWLIAGPGTGKTHTLSWLALKRVLVDGVEPSTIVFTTFTRRAARELEVRLLRDRQALIDVGVRSAANFEVADLMVGTLHAISSRVLQDARYPPVFRVPVLEDELTQQFFVRRTRNSLLNCDDVSFWARFKICSPRDRWAPRKADRAEAATRLFNRMTENQVDLKAMRRRRDPQLRRLVDAYEEYLQGLADTPRVDQASLQRHLLDFIGAAEGSAWVGKGLTVIVDEYQDTNPIQERIYFALAGTRGDLTVVGDDDQALYRFRGATVESLVDFDKASRAALGRPPTVVYLRENRRSHPQIVDWVNGYISRHPAMREKGFRIRAPSKPALQAKSAITGSYPAIVAVTGSTHRQAADELAVVIGQLHSAGLVADLSQVAVLSFSTKEGAQTLGPYCAALRAAGLPVNNPRSRQAQIDERVQQLVGGLSAVLQPSLDFDALPAGLPGSVKTYVTDARRSFDMLLRKRRHAGLKKWVDATHKAIEKAPFKRTTTGNYLQRPGGLNVTLSGLLYKLLGHEPFATSLADLVAGERMKALNLILAEYELLYGGGTLRLALRPDGKRRVDSWALYNFYAVFVEGIHDGLNDPEDEEAVDLLRGVVNVMTIHQTKGLEFEVVALVRPDKAPWAGETQQVEDILDPFSTRLAGRPRRRSQEARAAEDGVRLYFVAHSRARRLLMFSGVVSEKWNLAMGFDKVKGPIRRKADLGAHGVMVL
jgi:DNA helicase II / ATP-dependent DNA helicase PcrA